MAITGYLSEFSLAEIFQILEQGRKTGLLSLCAIATTQSETTRNHYVWFKEGQIVAAASSLNQLGLTALISQRGWLGDRAALKLAQSCSVGTPLGICLKSHGILHAEQLRLLFYTQVMRQVCELFELKDAWFQFDNKSPIPPAELTGLSATATQVTLAGLRSLNDWSALADKLPAPTSALINMTPSKPDVSLKPQEWQVWEFARGDSSLTTIAQQLQISVETVQRIGFRMIVIGLVEEFPLVEAALTAMPSLEQFDLSASNPKSTRSRQATPVKTRPSESKQVSQSFFQNLISFLQKIPSRS